MIKMRINQDKESKCCECGEEQRQVLNMFDLCIGGKKVTICDRCNEALLHKTLTAQVKKNGRIKTPRDIEIIRKRYSTDG